MTIRSRLLAAEFILPDGTVRCRGSSLVYLRYLYKTGRLPLVWYCTFYRSRPDAAWTLVAVRFDTELEGLFQQ